MAHGVHPPKIVAVLSINLLLPGIDAVVDIDIKAPYAALRFDAHEAPGEGDDDNAATPSQVEARSKQILRREFVETTARMDSKTTGEHVTPLPPVGNSHQTLPNHSYVTTVESTASGLIFQSDQMHPEHVDHHQAERQGFQRALEVMQRTPEQPQLLKGNGNVKQVQHQQPRPQKKVQRHKEQILPNKLSGSQQVRATMQTDYVTTWGRALGNFAPSISRSVELFIAAVTDLFVSDRHAETTYLQSHYFPTIHGYEQKFADAQKASRTQPVTILEPNTPIAVVYANSSEDKPCVSPVWEARDPVCANGRVMRGSVSSGSANITFWMIPPNETCRVRCSTGNWYLEPNVAEMHCGSMVFTNLPQSLECSCCKGWVIVMCILLVFFFTSLLLVAFYRVTANEAHRENLYRHQSENYKALAAETQTLRRSLEASGGTPPMDQ